MASNQCEKYVCITLTVRIGGLCVNKLVGYKMLRLFNAFIHGDKLHVCLDASMNLEAMTANIQESNSASLKFVGTSRRVLK